MINRIVKMTFEDSKTEAFLALFEEVKNKIRIQAGCQHLELWRDISNPNILFTYSIWNSEQDLENYRHSDLFKTTWENTKNKFSEKAKAWSVQKLYTSNTIK